MYNFNSNNLLLLLYYIKLINFNLIIFYSKQ